MAVTIDPRPTYFGDRMIVTGSYEAGDTSIVLGDILASVDAFILNPSSAVGQVVDTTPADDGGTPGTLNLLDVATVDGTTVTIAGAASGTTVAGTFLAIGRRS
tara:strand:- start:94 stop:402 length:309 start_codon:yes stop_codon:yes gene_type:complete